MKPFALFAVLLCSAGLACAESAQLTDVLPLLQAPHRSEVQNRRVLDLFASAQEPDLIFAAGASLVRIPPAQNQQARLLNLVMTEQNALKPVFAAIILTAMGTQPVELSSLLQQAAASQDPAVRSYSAAAYTILNPQDSAYTADIIHLYMYDPAFAQRAMNLLSSDEKQTFRFLKEASSADDAQVRAAAAAWLGDLQTPQAAKQLLKRARTETQAEASSALAVALAKNRPHTLDACVQGLSAKVNTQPAATYALALGFMTGHAVHALKQGLTDTRSAVRINAARAAAYMAGVLSGPQAAQYSTDPAFDAALLKGLIADLTALTQDTAAQPYAQAALQQIAKLN